MAMTHPCREDETVSIWFQIHRTDATRVQFSAWASAHKDIHNYKRRLETTFLKILNLFQLF